MPEEAIAGAEKSGNPSDGVRGSAPNPADSALPEVPIGGERARCPWTGRGWLFSPREPHPFGLDYWPFGSSSRAVES